jgi:hypothetical protein
VNERRAEHFSRLAELLIDEVTKTKRFMTPAMVMRARPLPADRTMLLAINPVMQLKHAPWKLTFRWGYDEIVMRAGPPHFIGRTGNGQEVAIYPHPRVSFVPDATIFVHHLAAEPDHWRINEPRAFEFMNGWLGPVRELDHQMAWFRRADSSRVVAATDIRSDSVYGTGGPAASLWLQRDYDQPAYRVEGTGTGLLTFAIAARPESTLVSIELLAKTGASGRARFAAGPPPMPSQRLTLSDFLLLEPSESAIASVEDALPRMLGSSRLGGRTAVSLFWEMYGLSADETPRISVVAVRQRDSFFGGLLRRITGSDGLDSLSVVWDEAPVAGRVIESRSVTIGLQSLANGTYSLAVVVDLVGQGQVMTRRVVEIARPRRR